MNLRQVIFLRLGERDAGLPPTWWPANQLIGKVLPLTKGIESNLAPVPCGTLPGSGDKLLYNSSR